MALLPAVHRTIAHLHLLSLAKKHRIHVTFITTIEDAHSYPSAREAIVPFPVTGADYLIALHEFGHVASRMSSRHSDSGTTDKVLVCEGAAWAWAANNLHPELASKLRASDFNYAGACWLSHFVYMVVHGTQAPRPL